MGGFTLGSTDFTFCAIFPSYKIRHNRNSILKWMQTAQAAIYGYMEPWNKHIQRKWEWRELIE